MQEKISLTTKETFTKLFKMLGCNAPGVFDKDSNVF